MGFKSKLLIISTLVLSTSANAALIERLGGLAYYDDVANLTWLADANAAVGSVYDTNNPGTGQLTYYEADNWAASLNVDGITGWRLPTISTSTLCNDTGLYYGYNCTGSELSNLFYNVLGGVATENIAITHNADYNLFSNIQLFYWASFDYAEFDLNPEAPYVDMNGYQFGAFKTPSTFNAWAVQSGDVSAVPVPAAMWLFGSGLLGLIGVARRKKS